VFKQHYKLFLEANKGVQHYAAHSHHYWPDVTREATLQYWDDSAKYVDDKWDYFFAAKVPTAQRLIAEVLNLTYPGQIVFAPNTHEFILRLLSCFDPLKPIRILTSDSEFHSFERQINRLSEESRVQVEKIATESFWNFEERFKERLKKTEYDLVFVSQVFFNSGYAIKNLQALVEAASPKTMFVIDGYHGFMAVPTDLKPVESRVFYIAGSYKYAQGGEGCCFMHVPFSAQHRPLNTGWFAGFAELSQKNEKVIYAEDGYRFAGSTMDFTGLYRLISVLQLFKKEGITVEKIHRHVQNLQKNFRQYIEEKNFKEVNVKNILKNDFDYHGHFYAFDLKDAAIVKIIHSILNREKVRTDYRGTRLRFGFGLYQEECINLDGIKNL
jgi:selenocysteine lyase/cysteine desulfurase